MIGHPSYDFPGARIVDALDPTSLPKGTRTRLQVALIHDGMGRPLRLPVIVAKGEKDGPVFGITAALHGNEINGIPVVHRLLESVDLHALRGTIVAVLVVNVPAYLNYERTFDDRIDMNHIMPGKPDGNIAEVYAHRFINRIVKQFEYLVDLHTASFGNINSLYVRADMTDPVTAEMAYLQRPQIILHNPPSDRTLRGTAMELGIPSVTVEIGDPQLFQPKKIKASVRGIRRVLCEIGMLARRPVTQVPAPILCTSSYWLYTQQGGLLDVFPKPGELIEIDQVLARQTNIFGDLLCEYRAKENGVVIGKSANPVGQTGARIMHIGRVTSAGTPPFVARVERKRKTL